MKVCEVIQTYDNGEDYEEHEYTETTEAICATRKRALQWIQDYEPQRGGRDYDSSCDDDYRHDEDAEREIIYPTDRWGHAEFVSFYIVETEVLE